MYSNIPKECKLTAFVPVNVPKTKDVFRRRGAQRSVDRADSSVFTRNPLEDYDHETRRMNQDYYERYRLMVESEKELSKDSESSNEPSKEDVEPE